MITNGKGYIICPGCKKPTKTRVRKDTALKNFPMWCPWCREEYIITTPEPGARATPNK